MVTVNRIFSVIIAGSYKNRKPKKKFKKIKSIIKGIFDKLPNAASDSSKIIDKMMKMINSNQSSADTQQRNYLHAEENVQPPRKTTNNLSVMSFNALHHTAERKCCAKVTLCRKSCQQCYSKDLIELFRCNSKKQFKHVCRMELTINKTTDLNKCIGFIKSPEHVFNEIFKLNGVKLHQKEIALEEATSTQKID